MASEREREREQGKRVFAPFKVTQKFIVVKKYCMVAEKQQFCSSVINELACNMFGKKQAMAVMPSAQNQIIFYTGERKYTPVILFL